MRDHVAATLTVLGSGTSSGVPLIGCRCKVCSSRNPKNRRLRASAWVRVAGKSLLIDTSTDLRQQALAHRIFQVDAVLYTHPHADHVHGIDELRAYNFLQKRPIQVFGNEWTESDLKKKFEYAFSLMPGEGGGLPQLVFHRVDSTREHLACAGLDVVPLSLRHGSKECLGYRFGSIAYLTDCQEIPEEAFRRLEGVEKLILDCVRTAPHRTHLNLDGALQAIKRIRPNQAWLTHLGHEFDQKTPRKWLPKGVEFAYDGLSVKFKFPSASIQV